MKENNKILKYFIAISMFVGFLMVTSCGSSSKKQRMVQRDHLVSAKKFYCEFINGEKYTDIDVTLNIFMAEKCDTTLPFSISSYKSPSDLPGMMYCCNIKSSSKDELKTTVEINEKPQAEPAGNVKKIEIIDPDAKNKKKP